MPSGPKSERAVTLVKEILTLRERLASLEAELALLVDEGRGRKGKASTQGTVPLRRQARRSKATSKVKHAKSSLETRVLELLRERAGEELTHHQIAAALESKTESTRMALLALYKVGAVVRPRRGSWATK